MAAHTLRQVCDILGMAPGTVRRLVAAGFVKPERGPRREYRFGFQDLILLRTAKGLADARLSPRRISQSLRRIRAELPGELPLSGLRISAGQDAVLVSQVVGRREHRWQAHDGQYLLAFEVVSPGGQVQIIEKVVEPAAEPAATKSEAEQLFAAAFALEAVDAQAAMGAYGEAVARHPALAAAYANWGLLLQERGRLEAAAAVYERGMQACPGDALLRFNLAVLREEQGRAGEARTLYEAALKLDDTLADAHYNLALLHEAAGRSREALRHYSAYRKRHRT